MTVETQGGETTKDPGIYLQERIDYWEFELLSADESSIDDIAVEALDELNFLWPHYDESVTYSGRGWLPVQGEGENPDLVDGIWSGMGVSQGFTIEDVEEKSDYRLYHQFLVGRSVEQTSIAKRQTIEHFAFMCTDTAVVLNAEIETAVTDKDSLNPQVIDPVEYTDKFADASIELMEMLGSIAFQMQAPNRQRRDVRRFIKGCEREIDLRNLGAIVETEHCFRPIPIENPESQHRLYEHVSIEDSIVTGVIVGFDAIEHSGLVPRKKRRHKEVFYREAGLCLLLAVKQSKESVLNPEDVILVPTGNQRLGISYTTMLTLPDIEDITGSEGDSPDDLVGA